MDENLIANQIGSDFLPSHFYYLQVGNASQFQSITGVPFPSMSYASVILFWSLPCLAVAPVHASVIWLTGRASEVWDGVHRLKALAFNGQLSPGVFKNCLGGLPTWRHYGRW